MKKPRGFTLISLRCLPFATFYHSYLGCWPKARTKEALWFATGWACWRLLFSLYLKLGSSELSGDNSISSHTPIGWRFWCSQYLLPILYSDTKTQEVCSPINTQSVQMKNLNIIPFRLFKLFWLLSCFAGLCKRLSSFCVFTKPSA